MSPSHPSARLIYSVFSILYTGGCDCLVRIWIADGGADQEPSAALHANQPITSVAVAVSLRVSLDLTTCL